jgi:uncharacterized protein YcbK (DUF882 family)
MIYNQHPLSPAERGLPESFVEVDGYPFDPEVAELVEGILQMHPQLHVVDGYRDARENHDRKGVEGSWHRYGRAADFAGPAEAMAQLAGMAQSQHGADEVHMHNAGQGQIVHLAWSKHDAQLV